LHSYARILVAIHQSPLSNLKIYQATPKTKIIASPAFTTLYRIPSVNALVVSIVPAPYTKSTLVIALRIISGETMKEPPFNAGG
jgi:hypothetical protein